MPKATVDLSQTHRVELTSVPGAWVELKKMSYQQLLDRRDKASRIQFRGEGKDAVGEVTAVSMQLTMMDFRLCIVDHNLFEDDEETQKLDLSNPTTFARLDPRIGEEINNAINKLNQFEEGEAKNSENGSGPASS